MRKLSAILLISLFTFSQYARQLSWLECQFSNSFKINAAKCDCEKKLGKQDNDQLPLSKIHTHIHLDEFFSAVKGILITPYFKIAGQDFNCLNAAQLCDGDYAKPWQPPNARVIYFTVPVCPVVCRCFC